MWNLPEPTNHTPGRGTSWPKAWRWVLATLLCAVTPSIASGAEPCANPDYQHGLAHLEPLQYPASFTHFNYTNPAAPKGGQMRVPQMGTFDSFNVVIEKGRLGAGFAATGGLAYDSLLEQAIDEPQSFYGRLAEGVALAPDKSWLAFKLRDNARWHDGTPLTPADVVFTFETFKTHGSVAHRTTMRDLTNVFAFGTREVCFELKTGPGSSPILPLTIGRYNILPKHYWETRDVTVTTIIEPLGSGPYRPKRIEIGRVVEYERVADYWGRDIPVNRGRYNFDIVKFDYFTDESVMLEAHKGNVFDVREESISKNWAHQYKFPAVQQGLFKRDLRPTARVEGLWWPIIWNTSRPHLADIRVREALWLLFDFRWTNRVLFSSYYDMGVSLFQNSKMAHTGKPSERELKLLEPWREQVPARVFTEPFAHPPSTGYGPQRENIRRAEALFREAGWEIRDGVMRNVETGQPFTLNFIGVSYFSIRQNQSLIDNLRRFGIRTDGRAPELSQWLYRSRTGKFDGNSIRRQPTFTPGLQLRNWFGSDAAGADYGQNWMQIRNPVVDALIEAVNQATTAEDLYAATRALDRVLLWNFYMIPMGSSPGFRLVHWDKFGEVRNDRLLRIPFIDAWWWDADKAARVAENFAENE